MPARARACRRIFCGSASRVLWDPSGAGKTRCPGACASWYSIQGRNAVGSGSTAAAPPFVVSRSCERATVIVPRARSTSLFLSAKSSPLRSPVDALRHLAPLDTVERVVAEPPAGLLRLGEDRTQLRAQVVQRRRRRTSRLALVQEVVEMVRAQPRQRDHADRAAESSLAVAAAPAPAARRERTPSTSSRYSIRWIPYNSASGRHEKCGRSHWVFGMSSSFQRLPASITWLGMRPLPSPRRSEP